MSSILDALQKVESAAPPKLDLGSLPYTPRPGRRRALGIGAAFVAGAGAAVTLALVLRHRPAGEVAAPAPVGVPKAATREPLPVAPPVAAPTVVDAERPWAQVDAPPMAPVPTPVAARAPHVEEPRLTPPPPPPVPAVEAPPVVVPPPPPGLVVQTGPVPRVKVSFLLYSAAVERRTVALSVEDGPLLTLREGQQAGGIEVTRILPDRVELRRDGQAFTVRARD